MSVYECLCANIGSLFRCGLFHISFGCQLERIMPYDSFLWHFFSNSQFLTNIWFFQASESSIKLAATQNDLESVHIHENSLQWYDALFSVTHNH